MVTFPLLAYIPGRSIAEAPITVFTFCAEIRTLCARQSYSPWRPQQTHSDELQGGIILSLDLKQAFDRLPRDELARGLQRCHCPDNIATVLIHWLVDARYELQHRGDQTWIHTSRGVRQGCKAPPLEWNAFLIRVITYIGQQTMEGTDLTVADWLRQHLLPKLMIYFSLGNQMQSRFTACVGTCCSRYGCS